MKLRFRILILAIAFLSAATIIQGCKDDKNEPEVPETPVTPEKPGDPEKPEEPETPAVELTASPATLSMLSDKGASVSFSIKSNSDWNISEIPQWMNLSATSGSGDASVTATALSQNDNDAVRTATIKVIAGEKTAEVKIDQLAAYVADCTVGFTDFLAMTTSIAFKYDIKPNVSYFYAGYLDVSSAGWTDEKIVQTLTAEDSFDPKNNDSTGLQGFAGMDPNTEYYLCSIAFTEKGERGKLTKTKVKTLATKNHAPYVTIENVTYSDTQWEWETEKNAYTTKYYMVGADGDYAMIYNYLFTEAEIAWMIRDAINAGSLSPIANSAAWSMNRTPGAEQVFFATWGVDVDNNYSPNVCIFYGDITSNYVVKQRAIKRKASKRTCIPAHKLRMIRNSLKVYSKR